MGRLSARTCAAIGLAAVVCLLPCRAQARAFEVRLLKGTEQNGIWGTDEFQVHVSSLGVLRHVKAHGKELIWQAAALYTSPLGPGQKKPPRTVQGEGVGARGLTVKPPQRTTRVENGVRIFEFEHLVANRKVLGGRDLCRVRQKITIRPTGEIHVVYDFEWLHTLRWRGFMLLAMFQKDTCRDREYTVIAGERIYAGKLEAGPITERRLRNVAIDQLTIRSEVGPFHHVWETKTDTSFYWGGGIQLNTTPSCVPYRGTVYQGQKGRIAYRILLPVSQQ